MTSAAIYYYLTIKSLSVCVYLLYVVLWIEALIKQKECVTRQQHNKINNIKKRYNFILKRQQML